jgi:hypothetical protein
LSDARWVLVEPDVDGVARRLAWPGTVARMGSLREIVNAVLYAEWEADGIAETLDDLLCQHVRVA